MGPIERFVIRLILAVLFAILMGRFFFQGTPVIKTIVLASALLGFAYLFEYLRKRGEGGNNGK
jgi:hypothetical protein